VLCANVVMSVSQVYSDGCLGIGMAGNVSEQALKGLGDDAASKVVK